MNADFFINPEETTLIIIDMQAEFLTKFRKKNLEPLIEANIALINFAEIKNIPIINFSYEDSGETHYLIEKELEKVKYPHSPTYLTKSKDSILAEYETTTFMQNKKNVIVTGVNCHACVQDSANDLIKEGYKIITSKDSIDDYIPGNKELSIEEFYGKKAILYETYRELFRAIKEKKL